VSRNGYAGKRFLPISRYYSSILLDTLRKTMISGRDSKRVLPEYKYRVLPLHQYEELEV